MPAQVEGLLFDSSLCSEADHMYCNSRLGLFQETGWQMQPWTPTRVVVYRGGGSIVVALARLQVAASRCAHRPVGSTSPSCPQEPVPTMLRVDENPVKPMEGARARIDLGGNEGLRRSMAIDFGGSTAICNKFIAATAGRYDAEATRDGLKISSVDVKQVLRVLAKADWSQNALKGACGVLQVAKSGSKDAQIERLRKALNLS